MSLLEHSAPDRAPAHPTLTDRYLDVVAHEVPHDRRDEVVAQVRASVESEVTARAAAGTPLPDAEREALEALGNPRRVADGAAGPRWLIGPRVYPDYVRVLRLVAVIAVPVVATVVAISTALAGQNPAGVVGSAVAAAANTAVMVAFWVSVVFVVLDRTGGSLHPDHETWSVADLPAPTRTRVSLGDTIGGIVMAVLLIAVVLWPWQYVPSAGADGVPVLSSDLRPGVTALLVTVLVASIALDVVVYLVGRWTMLLAAATTVLDLVFAGVVITLVASSSLFDPAFVEALAGSPVLDGAQAQSVVTAMGTALAWVVGIVCAADAVTSWVKALRARA